MKMDLEGEPEEVDLVEPAKDFGFDTRSSTGGFEEVPSSDYLLTVALAVYWKITW